MRARVFIEWHKDCKLPPSKRQFWTREVSTLLMSWTHHHPGGEDIGLQNLDGMPVLTAAHKRKVELKGFFLDFVEGQKDATELYDEIEKKLRDATGDKHLKIWISVASLDNIEGMNIPQFPVIKIGEAEHHDTEIAEGPIT